MGKNLKLNIKNLQLAGALNSKKAISSQKEEAQKKETTSSTEPEPTKRLTRLKDDASISTAIKQAEKTLAAREKEKESETGRSIGGRETARRTDADVDACDCGRPERVPGVH